MSYTAGAANTPGSAPLGYHPLWYRAEGAQDPSWSNPQQRIDVLRLAVQLVGVLILTNAGIWLLKDRKNEPS
jgi:hypothetical protein